ncbi:MAG TPA: dephospho-CoA kinase [Dehalococcoidia bacterium]|nr:dephospho-CoA kinase [Dehalococcoidia bacterium]
MVLIIGVTGSIATGKSHLCTYLVERYDAVHADADKVVHRMYDPGRPAFDRLVAAFGGDIVGADGFIDRKVLGSKVFGDRDKMLQLRDAIGDIPAELFDLVATWRATLAVDQIAILEAVNLIEGEYMRRLDLAWLTAAEDETAVARLMARNNFTRDEADQRLASARKWEDRAPASDHVFHNNTTLPDFEREIEAVYARTVADHSAGELGRPRWWRWKETQPPPPDRELPPDERVGSD